MQRIPTKHWIKRSSFFGWAFDAHRPKSPCHLRRLRNVVGVGVVAILSACGPDVSVGPVGDGTAARDLLITALEKGPVRAQVFGDPYGLDPARQDILVASNIGDGVQGIDARFSADPGLYADDQPILVVILNPQISPPPSKACSGPEQIRTTPPGEEIAVLAAFCQNGKLINAARADATISGPTDQRLKRLLWQTGAVLFPDDYEQSYGVDIIPGVNVGVGGSFGF